MVTKVGEINMGSLYDFNKNAMTNEKPLDPIALNLKANEVADWMLTDQYFMLLCRERNDFTLFNIIATENINPVQKELKETLMNRGYILAIDKTEDGVGYEIWIRDFETNENFVYYLFPYTKGVIEINE